MNKILITGANGLLGQALLKHLKKTNKILATGIEKELLFEPNFFEYQILDITDFQSCQNIIYQFKPDFIINAAAYTNVDQCESHKEICWKINVEGPKNLAQLAQENNSFLIHYSTDYIFDGNHGPYSEKDIPNPVGYYGFSKLASEKILQKTKCKLAIIRTCVLYGIALGVKSNFFLWIYESLNNGKVIQVVTDQYNNPTLVDDLAEGTRLIMESGATGIFHMGGGDYLNRYDFACDIANIFGFELNMISPILTAQLKQKASRPLRGGLDVEYAKKRLNYNPLSVRNSLVYLKSKMEKHDN